MWLHPNTTRLGAAEGLEERPYIDTPYLSYVKWLRASQVDGVTRIATFDPAPSAKVAIIGGGAAGLSAAFELLAAGLDVTVYEQSDQPGGRMDSVPFQTGSPDLAELGAMRFPPSEETLFYYFQKFGIQTTPDFPDPGKVPTLVSFKGDVQKLSGTTPPPGFETVAGGWSALMSDGATLDGVTLAAPTQIGTWMASGDADQVAQAIAAWQQWIRVMVDRSLFNGLATIFGAPNPPGGKTWAYPEDYERFAALGSGFGGFGPLYQVGFLELLRLVVNGLETDQVFVPGGIRQVAKGFLTTSITRPDGSTTYLSDHVRTGVTCGQITRTGTGLTIKSNTGTIEADRVIVATTTRAMEIDTGATRFGDGALLLAEAAAGVNTLHMMNSSKIFVRTKTRFWEGGGTRAILNDTLSRAVYTLSYDDPSGTGVVLVSYVWGDASTKQITLDKQARLTALRADIAEIDPDFAANLEPADGDYDTNVRMIDWETEPHYYGAFKLNRPGQDHYCQSAYYAFLTAGTAQDTGVFVAGSALSWTGGWIEGALQTGLNAAAAVVTSLGGTLTSASYNPMTQLEPGTYDYAPAGK